MSQSNLVQVAAQEPLSPWFDRKSYSGAPPPAFEAIRPRLPVPVLEADDGLIGMYWYCWKTLFSSSWLFPPTAPDHQAVANLLGARDWGMGGSTVVWDTCFMLHFARYANPAYPFITALDNCYARQHDNGFICREADAQNREVYWQFPLNPPLFAWTEWENYRISGDIERLRRVLMPVVKHYEWWMKYQRRVNGLYWNDGYNEADDSPRNKLEYYTASAASYQALAALYLARIAREVRRPDLEAFFTTEHAAIGKQVNTHFWDARHSIYNDLAHDGRFITELEPGVFCKHVHMFWPLIAEVADRRGVEGTIAELSNPKSFDRSSGVPSLSADSRGYREDGQYWRGAVWPPMQCMVQEGLRLNGEWARARSLAEKYLRALLTAFQSQKSIYENLAPDSPKGYGGNEFVGWGGIGPVSNLIEYTLGLQVDAPGKTIEWHIERTDRHGIQNLGFGHYAVHLICERRESAQSACHIEVESDGEFTLKVILQGKVTSHAIKKGGNTLVVGA
jgi:glycogen debranching enzyme